MLSVRKCCVPNCNVSRSDGKVSLHAFPNPEKDLERFHSWVHKIGGDLLLLNNQCIYKKRRVCHKHFETKYHTRTKLTLNAVPNLYIPEAESYLSERDSLSLQIKNEVIDIAQDEPEQCDDVPDNLSMYYNDDDDDDTHTMRTKENNGDSRYVEDQCDHCNSAIVGFRYTCVQCSKFDLCNTCEWNNVHAHHYMLRVPGLRPYNEIHLVLGTIRSYLMRELNPISSAYVNDKDAVSVKSEIKSENSDEVEVEQDLDTRDEDFTNHELIEHSGIPSMEPPVHLNNTDIKRVVSQNDMPYQQRLNTYNMRRDRTQRKSLPKVILSEMDTVSVGPKMKIFKVKDTKESPRIMTVGNKFNLLSPSDADKGKVLIKISKLVELKQYNRLPKKTRSVVPNIRSIEEITENSMSILPDNPTV